MLTDDTQLLDVGVEPFRSITIYSRRVVMDI